MYVATLNLALADRLLRDLQSQGFEITIPPHTRFSGKKKGISCTLYNSGKLVVQGKEIQEFVEFYLEPELLQMFTFKQPPSSLKVDTTPRIGIDESGKGDFFGPLCIAGVYAAGDQVAELLQIGVKDSKLLSDDVIMKWPKRFGKNLPTMSFESIQKSTTNFTSSFTISIGSSLGGTPQPLNSLLQRPNAPMSRSTNLQLNISLKPHYEERNSTWNCSNSIEAKPTPLWQRPRFSHAMPFSGDCAHSENKPNVILPKGASALVVNTARNLVRQMGREALGKFAKIHFKTTLKVLGDDYD